MSEIPLIKTPDSFKFFIDDDIINVPLDHPRIEEVKKAFRDKDGVKIREIVDLTTSIQTSLQNSTEEIAKDVTIEDGAVKYKGKAVHTVLTDRIIELRAEGLPVEPWCRFLSKLMKNPSFHSRNQLFLFLENNNLPLADDGDFYAYKGVTLDYKDCHTKSVDNSVGITPPRMDRNEVDDNVNNACSHGYHAGSFEYATSFGARVVLVKINPEDAVCVPHDSAEKLRMCGYTVIKDCTHKMDRQLYTSTLEDYDDEYDDDDYDDYYDDDYDDDDCDDCEVDWLFAGYKIQFDYEGLRRTAWVKEDRDPIVHVELATEDPKHDTFGNLRNFRIDKMDNVKLV